MPCFATVCVQKLALAAVQNGLQCFARLARGFRLLGAGGNPDASGRQFPTITKTVVGEFFSISGFAASLLGFAP